jgi:hypothetical protein
MTAYDQALRRASGNVAHCDDAALMASFLEGSAQLLLGAVSPKLIWEGAQAQGLTAARGRPTPSPARVPAGSSGWTRYDPR